MASLHCLKLKQSWNLYYFYFFLKSAQMHLLLPSWEMGKHIPHSSQLCKDKLCSVWETRCSQGKTEDEKEKAEYFRNQNQGQLNNFTTASWRLLFARYLRPGRYCKGLLSHCPPHLQLVSHCVMNHTSTPNISWTLNSTPSFAKTP